MAHSNSIYCPSCHQHTSIHVVSHYEWPKNRAIKYEIGECNNCDFFVLVKRYASNITDIYPTPLPKPINVLTPQFLTDDLKEAYVCFLANAFRATAVLARRALQMCCFDKGAPDKPLKGQIEWLLTKQIITHDLKQWADEVKETGNDAAHPSKKITDDQQVSENDAEDILLLLEKFIDVLYIAPALANQRKQKRENNNS